MARRTRRSRRSWARHGAHGAEGVVAENNVSSFVKAVTGELDAWRPTEPEAGSAKKIAATSI